MGSRAASRAAPRAGQAPPLLYTKPALVLVIAVMLGKRRGKPRPYYTRLGVPFVYSRGDPCGQPGCGARPSQLVNRPVGKRTNLDSTK